VTATILAALKWDPTIRGILFPLIQFVILCGSSYVILGTNIGNRLGFLLANAAFWGWMTLMTIVWMIYGIGLLGKSPSWHGEEAIREPSTAQLAKMSSLPTDGSEVKGWTSLKEGSRTRGEAGSSVDAYLKEKIADGGAQLFPEKGGPFYKSIAAYETGGEQIIKVRPRLKPDGDWYNPSDYRWMGLLHGERHYVEVIREYALDDKGNPIPGAKSGEYKIDETKKPIYVSMVRDLGSKRLPAFRIFLASLILLIISASALHKRDKQLMAFAKANPARA
jgi:hypothetical protein